MQYWMLSTWSKKKGNVITVFTCFQMVVKSVLHWAHLKGCRNPLDWFLSFLSRSRMVFTTSSSPTRITNSLLAALGRKCSSGGGGFGGGICRRVFSSCLRNASLAAACLLAADWPSLAIWLCLDDCCWCCNDRETLDVDVDDAGADVEILTTGARTIWLDWEEEDEDDRLGCWAMMSGGGPEWPFW